ncbi:MAG: (Fe-S)-binding protein [Candidatus Rokubacteria bacterium]|nr:(Fe-S)-binding protein [Candidatus Rokubacteria bacterium]
MKASLMITCLGEMLFPEVGVAIVTLLRRLGVTVDFPPRQTCCGLPLFNSGYHRAAARVAARTVSLFEGSEHVVVPSGSCAWLVKQEYPALLARHGGPAEAARALAARTWELSQFLVKVLGVTDVGSRFQGRVTYHDSCHLLRGLGEAAAPRSLLRGVRGLELVELDGAEECCGFGGAFSVRLPEVSAAILGKKVRCLEQTGAGCVVACDAGCLMQMGGALSRAGSRVQPLHLAQVLSPDGTSR